MLEKSSYLINGFGYMCIRKKICIFFGNIDSFRDENFEIIDRHDCLAIYISKKCQNQLMARSENSCQIVIEPVLKSFI